MNRNAFGKILPILAIITMVPGCGGSDGTPAAQPPPAPAPVPPSPSPPPPPPPPPPSGALYAPPARYTVGIKDNLSVIVAPDRVLPIRIRYPSNFRPAAGEKLPVVIWSHGGDLNGTGHLSSAEWGNALAASGYVVIHMAHLPQTTAQRDALYADYGLTPAQGLACFTAALALRPRDAHAVIRDVGALLGQITELPAAYDPARIAVAGHSFGAYTTRTISGARVDLCPNAATVSGLPVNWPHRNVSFRSEIPVAFMALSPQGPGRFGFSATSWAGLNRPDITMSGDGDFTQGEQPSDRIIPYELMPAGDKWLMYIGSTAAAHDVFNLNNNAQPDLVNQVRSTGLAFMDTYLQNSVTARTWLMTNELNRYSSGVSRVEGR